MKEHTYVTPTKILFKNNFKYYWKLSRVRTFKGICTLACLGQNDHPKGGGREFLHVIRSQKQEMDYCQLQLIFPFDSRIRQTIHT